MSVSSCSRLASHATQQNEQSTRLVWVRYRGGRAAAGGGSGGAGQRRQAAAAAAAWPPMAGAMRHKSPHAWNVAAELLTTQVQRTAAGSGWCCHRCASWVYGKNESPAQHPPAGGQAGRQLLPGLPHYDVHMLGTIQDEPEWDVRLLHAACAGSVVLACSDSIDSSPQPKVESEGCRKGAGGHRTSRNA